MFPLLLRYVALAQLAAFGNGDAVALAHAMCALKRWLQKIVVGHFDNCLARYHPQANGLGTAAIQLTRVMHGQFSRRRFQAALVAQIARLLFLPKHFVNGHHVLQSRPMTAQATSAFLPKMACRTHALSS